MAVHTQKPVFLSPGSQDVFINLRQEVKELVKQLEPGRRKAIVAQAVLFPFLYVLTYAAALTWGSHPVVFFGCYFLMGLLIVFVFLNVIHDAVHGTIFRSRGINQFFVHFFDLMGANSFIWQLRHVRFHHNYPNVNGWDTDIEQSTIFRVFPGSTYAPVHRYQHIYLPLLYPFYLANWLLVRDFKDFFNRNKPVHKLVHIPAVEFVKLFVFKAIFLFYTIALPAIILPISIWQALAAFALMLFTASIFSLAVLLSPHANTENDFPLPDKNNRLPHTWMLHMMLTTNDVSHNNFFTRFFMGCFNYHVAHHLFPNVNHVFYPEITQLLRKYADLYKLPYREYSLAASLKNHYRLLKRNSVRENIFEETM